jgi:hypothetical protein
VSEDLEPIKESLEALVGEAGLMGPVREYGDYLRTKVHMRNLPKLANRAMAVAAKIKDSGLPRKAWDQLDEPLVTAILEGMAEEIDPDLAEAWEILLTNTLVEEGAGVRRAFPRILKELGPDEAWLLGYWRVEEVERGPLAWVDVENEDVVAMENLVRLGLVREEMEFPLREAYLRRDERPKTPSPRDALTATSRDALPLGYAVTKLGLAFLEACEGPRQPSYRRRRRSRKPTADVTSW